MDNFTNGVPFYPMEKILSIHDKMKSVSLYEINWIKFQQGSILAGILSVLFTLASSFASDLKKAQAS